MKNYNIKWDGQEFVVSEFIDFGTTIPVSDCLTIAEFLDCELETKFAQRVKYISNLKKLKNTHLKELEDIVSIAVENDFFKK